MTHQEDGLPPLAIAALHDHKQACLYIWSKLPAHDALEPFFSKLCAAATSPEVRKAMAMGLAALAGYGSSFCDAILSYHAEENDHPALDALVSLLPALLPVMSPLEELYLPLLPWQGYVAVALANISHGSNSAMNRIIEGGSYRGLILALTLAARDPSQKDKAAQAVLRLLGSDSMFDALANDVDTSAVLTEALPLLVELFPELVLLASDGSTDERLFAASTVANLLREAGRHGLHPGEMTVCWGDKG